MTDLEARWREVEEELNDLAEVVYTGGFVREHLEPVRAAVKAFGLACREATLDAVIADSFKGDIAMLGGRYAEEVKQQIEALS